jgi:glycosyltransferase involved in cell wall biosynthesis
LSSEIKSLQKKPVALSVVVPVYNEEESLLELHAQICGACEGVSFEIVYVDDCSKDGSFGVLTEIYEKDPRAKVIQFRRNFGKSEALSAGFSAASGEIVVTMDADLQDDPAEIPQLLAKLEEGYDLVSGWKRKRKDPLSKRIPSRLWNFVISKLTGVRIHDLNCGLKIYKREVVDSVEVYGELHRYIPAMAHWEGFRVGEIPVNHRPRKYGKSKYGSSRFVKGFLDFITIVFLSRYTTRPLHVFGLIGMLSFLGGSVITLYLIVLRVTKASYLSNRPLLFIGVLLLILGIQFISIGLLGEMIARSNASHQSPSIRRTLGV